MPAEISDRSHCHCFLSHLITEVAISPAAMSIKRMYSPQILIFSDVENPKF